jgi:glutathione S-transferase
MQAQEKEKQDLARTELYDALRKFAAQAKGPYFLGEEFSLVDVAIVPWITRDYILSEHRGYSREDIGAEWKQYADLVEKRESVLKTKSVSEQYFCELYVSYFVSQDRDKYEEIYGRYLRDEAQSEAAKAIRAGRIIP